jgi:hypothetical protein
MQSLCTYGWAGIGVLDLDVLHARTRTLAGHTQSLELGRENGVSFVYKTSKSDKPKDSPLPP